MSDEFKTSEFTLGEAVTYVPHHAFGDLAHPDVERGTVHSINTQFVFVRYAGTLHARATSPRYLRKQFSGNSKS